MYVHNYRIGPKYSYIVLIHGIVFFCSLQFTQTVPTRPQSAPAPSESTWDSNILTQAFAAVAGGPTPPEARPFRTSLTLGDSITSQDLVDLDAQSQHSTSRVQTPTAQDDQDPDRQP